MTQRRIIHFWWLAAACALAGCSGGNGVSGVLEVARVEVEPPGTDMVLGGTLQLTATAYTASGIPVPNRTPTWTSSNQAIATVSTTGLVTAHAVGPVVIRASVDGVVGTSNITVSPTPVSTVTVEPSQADIQVGQTAQFTATPRAANGQALNRQVTWSTDNPAVATIGTDGVAIGVAPGVTTVRATAEGKTGTADLTVRSRPAVRLSFVVQPAGGTAGQALTPPLQVAVQDEIGGTVTSATTTITLSLSTNPTGAILKGTLVKNAVAGIATFSDLVLEQAGTGYVITAEATALSPALSNAFAIASGPAQNLILATAPPTTAASGVPLSPQPVVRLQDAFGNPVAQAGVQITAQIASGTGATLSGSVVVPTDATGAATFSSLTINGPAGGYTLRFSGGGLVPVVSGTITLGAGGANQLTLVTQPSSSAQSGVPLSQQPSLQLRDASGNPVPQAGVTVTATVNPAGGSLGGTTTAVTNSAGLVSFTNLAISGPVGSYTLSFAASGITGVTSGPITLAAGPAARLEIVTQPSSSATSGIDFPTQPVIQLTDQSGNPVTQTGVSVTAALASGSGTLGGTLTVATNSNGRARFTDLSITGPAGTYTISFSAAGLTGTVSNGITLGAGTATKLVIVTQPSSSAQSGVPFPQQPVVALRDAQDNPVAQAGVSVTASIASGSGTLGGTVTVQTDASGVATFTNLSISGTVGNYTLSFSAAGLTGVTSNTIALTAGVATQLVVTVQPSSTAQSGVPFAVQPIVRLRDAAGNNVLQSGVSVTASIASGAGGTLSGVLTIVTNANGQAVYTDLAITGASGNYTLGFAATGLTGATSNTIQLGAGAGSKLAITQQPSATVANGVNFPQQPIIQLLDAFNNPVAQGGVLVTATIQTGAPALSGTTTVPTDATGKATFTDLRITGVTGDRTLIFAASGFVSVSSNTITVTAGAPTALQLTTQPSASAQNGVPFPQQPVVQLLDQSGNLVSQSGVTVTAEIASGGGTLGGTTAIATNASGAAVFTNLQITGTVGDRTIRFESTGLSPVTSNIISVSAGPADRLTITTQPSSSGQLGVPFPQQPVIQLRDVSGNPVSQANVNVTAVIASSPGGSPTLNGTVTVATNGSGVATFTNLSISGQSGDYTLRFDATGLTSVTSQTITLASGPPAKLAITTQPSSTVQSGVAFPQQPVIQVQDAGGNPVSQAGIDVTVTIASGAGSLGGTTTVTTNGSGVAAFTNLTITGTIGDRTLQFDATGLTGVVSNTITVTPGPASQLTITTQPPAAAVASVPFSPQPVIQLRDASGNAVSQAGVNVTAVIASSPGGSPTLGGTTTVATNSSGVAQFTNLSINGPGGAYTLGFEATGLSSVTSQTITLSSGGPTQLAITTQPSSSAQSGVAFPQQPVIQLEDASGNPVPQAGFSVTAVIASSPGGSPTLGGTTSVTTDVNGVATFTNLSITGLVGNYTLRFDAAGLTSVISNTITLTVGSASRVLVTQEPSSSAQNTIAFGQQPKVRLVDGGGNFVTLSGVNVTAAIFSGGGTLGGTVTVATDGTGTATFTNLAITGTIGDRTLEFTAPSLTSDVSAVITITPGPVTQMAITTQPPGSAVTGVALSPAPVVQLQDVSGNAVSQAGVAIDVEVNPPTGGASLGGTTSVSTAANGSATFSNVFFQLTTPPGSYQIRFKATGLTNVISNSISVL